MKRMLLILILLVVLSNLVSASTYSIQTTCYAEDCNNYPLRIWVHNESKINSSTIAQLQIKDDQGSTIPFQWVNGTLRSLVFLMNQTDNTTVNYTITTDTGSTHNVSNIFPSDDETPKWSSNWRNHDELNAYTERYTCENGDCAEFSLSTTQSVSPLQSLKGVAGGGDRVKIETSATSGTNTGNYSIWFYDDNSANAFWSINPRDIGATEVYPCAVHTAKNANTYTYYDGGAYQNSGIARTTGWHLCQWQTNAGGTSSWIDKTSTGLVNDASVVNTDNIRFALNPGVYTVYFDDFRMSTGQYKGTEAFMNYSLVDDTTPPNITQILITSGVDSAINITSTSIIGNTTDSTTSFNLTTDESCTMGISKTNSSYAECSTTGATAHICTLNTTQTLSEGNNNIFWNCTDASSNYFTTNRTVELIVEAVNLSLASYTTNITAELGSAILVKAVNNAGNSVCISINHHDYGSNYSCDTGTLTFNASIDEFRATVDNASRTKFNLTFTDNALENETFWISSHQYMEIVNLTMNVTGYSTGGSFPANIKIYVNDTLSNNIGDIEGTLSTFNDSTTSKNTTFTTEETQTVGYFKLPKSTTVTGAKFDVKGFNHTYLQGTSDNVSYSANPKVTVADPESIYFYSDYEKHNRTFVAWDIRHGTLDRYNITSIGNCLTNNQNWLEFNIFSKAHRDGQSESQPRCYDGNWQNVGTADNVAAGIHSTTGNGGTRMIDNDYDTYECMEKTSQTSTWRRPTCTGSVLGTAWYEEGVWWTSYTWDPWIQIGALNGTHNWNYTDQFDVDNGSIDDFTASLNDYLDTCTADDEGYCYAPVYLYSYTGGIFEITDVEINYSISVINPVALSLTALSSFLNNSNNSVDIPIIVESSRNGTVEISDIKLDYRGGNKTYEFFSHTPTYSLNSTLQTILYYYSDWTHSFPKNVDYMEFIPTKGPTQKNVTPYGQTTSRPILNFTSQAYGGKNFNFTILINESFSCINDTVSLTNNKSEGTLLVADTWIDYNNSISYEDTFKLWSWADYQCNYSTWYLWDPYWYFRACCVGCTICDSTVYNVVEM